MESLLPADLNFKISDDVLSNVPLPDYGSNVIQNFSGSVFNNYTINFVCKLKNIKYSPTICCFS